jgi:di/tricarboxylate transporter
VNATTVFALGTLTTLGFGLGVVWYVRRPLQKILVELCGNQERAAFWTVFSAVSLGTVPVICAIACRPAPGPGAPAVFELADQVKWGLIGMMGSLMALGWVIGRSIVRWELRAVSKKEPR